VVTRAAEVAGFAREIDHTADLGIEVDAPTLPLLFERAGLAMLALMVDLSAVVRREEQPLQVAASGREELLHDWLQALLVRLQAGRFIACELTVDAVGEGSVSGIAGGERIDGARHRFYTEIKGVTWHDLAVRETPAGWCARVIFDV
jgi:SHS2 domain-containing protein